MVEVLGAATAIGMAAVTARLSLLVGEAWGRTRDESRFAPADRADLTARFVCIEREASLGD
jgi:hypothetical protein